MARPPVIEKRTSAGGVVFRKESGDSGDGSIGVVLVLVRGKDVWCLPKGIIDKGEAVHEAALREVREETGLRGSIIDKIGHVSYWYFLKNDMIRVHKTVHFYLMSYVDGSTDDHDYEVDQAQWFPIEQALKRLSYRSERDILRKAKGMIELLPQGL
jgi:8-oxo-dGTP diphosphatase